MTNSTHRYQMALEIGEEAVRQGQWQQALTCFQTALTGLPREARIYNGLGDTHLALADRGRALACYKEAARLAGRNPDYTAKVATLQERLGLLPDAAATYLLTGDLLWRAGRHEPAQTNWEQCARLRPDLPAIHERLAMADRRRGDAAGAVRHYMALADSLRRAGRCLLALHVCCAALSLTPDSPRLWATTEDAWRCVAARNGADGHPTRRVEPGDLLNAAAEFAQWQLTAALRQSTLRPSAALAEGDTYLRQALLQEGHGHAGPAIAAYERAIAAGRQPPALFFALGLLYRLVGRRADARAALTLAARHPFYRQAVALLE
jgi:tetratricopeptide (TPR) repeat protein